MSVQSGQDNYNKNTRPAKLAEKHEATIKQIKELQELEEEIRRLSKKLR